MQVQPRLHSYKRDISAPCHLSERTDDPDLFHRPSIQDIQTVTTMKTVVTINNIGTSTFFTGSAIGIKANTIYDFFNPKSPFFSWGTLSTEMQLYPVFAISLFNSSSEGITSLKPYVSCLFLSVISFIISVIRCFRIMRFLFSF